MVLTSNIAPSGWDRFFVGDDMLLCALDQLFDKASVFMMRKPSYRRRRLGTYSAEAVPQATIPRGTQSKGILTGSRRKRMSARWLQPPSANRGWCRPEAQTLDFDLRMPLTSTSRASSVSHESS